MRVVLSTAIAACALVGPDRGLAAQQVLPSADGTLADGDPYGAFDGTADFADWIFNESSFEGAITRAQSFEHRVVFEFNLASLSATPPVTARLSFALRGAARYPADAALVQVFAYPADGLESLADFAAGPATLVGAKSIPPFSPKTQYVINVSAAVNAALAGGATKIGFRFRVDPSTVADTSQAFMDAVDNDPATKPAVSIEDRVPSDFDSDRDIDLLDYAFLAECLNGPSARVSTNCNAADSDLDGDVDAVDVASFYVDWARYGSR